MLLHAPKRTKTVKDPDVDARTIFRHLESERRGREPPARGEDGDLGPEEEGR